MCASIISLFSLTFFGIIVIVDLKILSVNNIWVISKSVYVNYLLSLVWITFSSVVISNYFLDSVIIQWRSSEEYFKNRHLAELRLKTWIPLWWAAVGLSFQLFQWAAWSLLYLEIKDLGRVYTQTMGTHSLFQRLTPSLLRYWGDSKPFPLVTEAKIAGFFLFIFNN